MKPNILFIMTDQQRYDTIGDSCVFKYPNMEQLKKESLSFSNFYVSATACVPSRACFLMGRNAWDLHIYGNSRFLQDQSQTGPLEKSWMQILRERGYACVSVGKTHEIHAGSFHIPVPLGKSFGERDGWDHFHVERSPEPEETFFDICTARRTCDALDRFAGGNRQADGTSEREPFALFAGFHAPHEPYVLPEKYLSFCGPGDVTLPKNRSLDEYHTKSAAYRRRIDHFRKLFGDFIVTDDVIRRGIAGYHCSLKMVDDCIGMVMEKMRSTGLLDNTLVIFTSDHGEMRGEHYLFNKNATAYEAETHIPFFIRFPDGRKAGETVSRLSCAIDFLPTLMDILKIDPDLPLPGYSLLPAINEGREVRDHVLIWHSQSSLTLYTEKAKLVYCPEDQDGELYNLADDPGEMNNLWNEKGGEALRKELILRMLHSRLWNDKRSSAFTRRERRLHAEVLASMEPEVV
jgi:arylsulfatase A-like enzyme